MPSSGSMLQLATKLPVRLDKDVVTEASVYVVESIEKEFPIEISSNMICRLNLVSKFLSHVGVHTGNHEISWTHDRLPRPQMIHGKHPVIIAENRAQRQKQPGTLDVSGYEVLPILKSAPESSARHIGCRGRMQLG